MKTPLLDLNKPSTTTSSTRSPTALPTIELDGRRGPSDEGRLLQLPDDFTPVPDVSIDTLRRAVSVQELLREEEQRACDAGMTVEELRYYQDLLQKRF